MSVQTGFYFPTIFSLSKLANCLSSYPKQFYVSNIVSETLWSTKPKEPSPVQEVPPQLQHHHQTLQPRIEIIKQDANCFFTYRDGVAEKAANECANEFLDIENEGPVIQWFLLTQ